MGKRFEGDWLVTRGTERHATGLIAVVSKDGKEFHCLVDDISEGGLGLQSTALVKELKAGDSVDCLVQLPDGAVKCSGEVTWIKLESGTTGIVLRTFSEGEGLLQNYARLPW